MHAAANTFLLHEAPATPALSVGQIATGPATGSAPERFAALFRQQVAASRTINETPDGTRVGGGGAGRTRPISLEAQPTQESSFVTTGTGSTGIAGDDANRWTIPDTEGMDTEGMQRQSGKAEVLTVQPPAAAPSVKPIPVADGQVGENADEKGPIPSRATGVAEPDNESRSRDSAVSTPASIAPIAPIATAAPASEDRVPSRTISVPEDGGIEADPDPLPERQSAEVKERPGSAATSSASAGIGISVSSAQPEDRAAPAGDVHAIDRSQAQTTAALSRTVTATRTHVSGRIEGRAPERVHGRVAQNAAAAPDSATPSLADARPRAPSQPTAPAAAGARPTFPDVAQSITKTFGGRAPSVGSRPVAPRSSVAAPRAGVSPEEPRAAVTAPPTVNEGHTAAVVTAQASHTVPSAGTHFVPIGEANTAASTAPGRSAELSSPASGMATIATTPRTDGGMAAAPSSPALHASPGSVTSAFERMDGAAPPQLIESTPQRLAVGVRDPGLGWVEIRTHAAAGQVAATLAASGASHPVITGELPRLREYLDGQQVRVDHLASESFSTPDGDRRGNDSGHQGEARAARGSAAREPAPALGNEEEDLSYINVRV